MIECKNCGTAFEGKFCPNCSQKAATHRLTLGHFVHETTHAVTHTDKGILLLIKEMFVRPGIVAREYVEGKRKKYFNPLTFLLIMIAIQVFVTKQTDFYGKFTRQMQKLYEMIEKSNPNAAKGKEKFTKQVEEADKRMAFANDNSKIMNFIFIPFLSLLTWLFFKKSGYNYAENLILNVLIGGQTVVLFFVICIIPVMIKTSLVIIVLYLYLIVLLIYGLIAYRQFFQQKWRWVILKGLTLQIIYFVVLSTASDYILKFFL
ncbi:MAG TPA: DUF3667 domain-containing protein [Chryseosolibacter sp.]